VIISKDNCCDLGIWLYGEGKSLHGSLASHTECSAKHKLFHVEAGKVASAINSKQYTEAEAMLNTDTPYFLASSAVGVAIMRLKKEARLDIEK
jgi:methyl-accepting chemotaxis protein